MTSAEMKKALRWILCLLILPMVLVMLVAVLLYVPPVQRWAVGKAASYASEATGMSISVGAIRLSFPLNLGVERVLVVQPSDSLHQHGDTIASLGSLTVRVGFGEVLSKRLAVNTFDIEQAQLNTGSMIPSMSISGSVGRMLLSSRPVDLGRMEVHIGEVALADADVSVAMADTVIVDTADTAPIPWTFYINRVAVERTRIAFATAGDTMRIAATLGDVEARQGVVDLAAGEYSAQTLHWRSGSVSMDYPHEPAAEGLDPNHLLLSSLALRLDSIHYSEQYTQLVVSHLTLREKSGLEVTSLRMPFHMDTASISIPSLSLRTPDSSVDAELHMDLNAMAEHNPGQLSLRLLAALGKQDIMRFCGALPQQFVERYPNRPLTVRASADGNMDSLDIAGLDISLPTAMRLTASGHATNLADSVNMGADISLRASTEDMGFILALADTATANAFSIPSGMTLNGSLRADGPRYGLDLVATEGEGSIDANASIDMGTEAYKADISISRLNLTHFMPRDSMRTLTVSIDAEGRGFDFLSPRTRLVADASLDSLSYGSLDVADVVLNARLEGGKADARLTSRNALLRADATLSGLLSRRHVEARLAVDVDRADLQRLRVSPNKLDGAVRLRADMGTDLNSSHRLTASVTGMGLTTAERTYHPKDIALSLATNPDTTWANVGAGNLSLDLAASGGYELLMEQAQAVADEAMRQLRERNIDQTTLREKLPTAQLRMTCGDDNPLVNYLKTMGVSFSDLNVDLHSTPATGLVGDLHLLGLIADSTQIDTVRFHIAQGSRTLVNFRGQVRNAADNPQFVFNALLGGTLYDRGAAAGIDFYDGKGRQGLKLGAVAEVGDSGLHVRLVPEKPVLAYKQYALNKDNYILLGRGKRVMANVDLQADDGTRINISSDRSDSTMLQDLTLTLEKLDIGEITAMVPYAPSVQGVLGGYLRVMMDSQERLAMTSSLAVDSLVYEKNRFGDIGTSLEYLLDSEVGHTVEGRLSRNGTEVATLDGTYSDQGEGYLDATLSMKRFPLFLANGFIPDRILGLRGYGNGDLSVKGPLGRPLVDGQLMLDSARIFSVPYGISMRVDDKPVHIVGSNLLLERLTLYSPNNDKLFVDGNVNFADASNIGLNVSMRASDYLLIDAKKRRRSVAYGKAFVNFFANVGGSLNMMRIRGLLEVLGKTDLTYILTDTPLSTDDQLKDLVTFTDFRDTTHVEVTREPVGGIDMQMTVNIVEGARVKCALNRDESNYVNLEGGGELSMALDPINDLRLNGRYTVTSGEMKYALPVIPLKTFTIKEGSYIEFTGEAMNPHLNLAATEQVRSQVSSSDGSSRTVLFECGVKVTQTLSNMGLEFTLDAPEDMTLKNELAAMSVEERGKLAVTMLTTGMYIGGGNSSSADFTMNNALNTFLQSQINNITSSAMKSVDLSVGMDQSTDAAGNTSTDYSFKFAKRLWNNRVNFVIGGKISSGSSSAMSHTDDNTFIDNVSLEYRLDATSMRYVRLFYNKNADDLLEGRVAEYGAGFVWRKKLERLSDLFRSSNRMPQPQPERRDTTSQLTKPNEQ